MAMWLCLSGWHGGPLKDRLDLELTGLWQVLLGVGSLLNNDGILGIVDGVVDARVGWTRDLIVGVAGRHFGLNTCKVAR